MNNFTVSGISPNKAAQIFTHIDFNKETGCWLWTKSVNADGYGYTSFRHKTVYIHRFIYAWLINQSPMGKEKIFRFSTIFVTMLVVVILHI